MARSSTPVAATTGSKPEGAEYGVGHGRAIFGVGDLVCLRFDDAGVPKVTWYLAFVGFPCTLDAGVPSARLGTQPATLDNDPLVGRPVFWWHGIKRSVPHGCYG